MGVKVSNIGIQEKSDVKWNDWKLAKMIYLSTN